MRSVQCKAFRPAALLSALAAALAAGGCSLAVPLLSGESAALEPVSTGTIVKKPEPVLAAELGPEDWRRASAALAVALDPQGNGRPVKWDNPETALQGSINPTAPPFVQNDEICRAFQATVAGPGLAKAVHGTACRPSGGTWTLKQVGPKPAPARRS